MMRDFRPGPLSIQEAAELNRLAAVVGRVAGMNVVAPLELAGNVLRLHETAAAGGAAAGWTWADLHVAATNNNVALAAGANVIYRLVFDSGTFEGPWQLSELTGIVPPGAPAAAYNIVLTHGGGVANATLRIRDEDGRSATPNRIRVPVGAALLTADGVYDLRPYSSVLLSYDPAALRWKIIGDTVPRGVSVENTDATAAFGGALVIRADAASGITFAGTHLYPYVADVALLAAGQSQNGAMTTGAQTFAGQKQFVEDVTAKGFISGVDGVQCGGSGSLHWYSTFTETDNSVHTATIALRELAPVPLTGWGGAGTEAPYNGTLTLTGGELGFPDRQIGYWKWTNVGSFGGSYALSLGTDGQTVQFKVEGDPNNVPHVKISIGGVALPSGSVP